MRKIRDCEFVIVEWLDSAEVQGWKFHEDLNLTSPTRCFSAGWVVAEHKDFIAVAGSVADWDDENPGNFQHCGVMQIPKVSIIRVIEAQETAAELSGVPMPGYRKDYVARDYVAALKMLPEDMRSEILSGVAGENREGGEHG